MTINNDDRTNRQENQPDTIRYHLTINGKRTTISLDKVISNLVAIKSGIDPFSENAHSKIRQKLLEVIPFNKLGFQKKPTQFITEYALLWIVGKEMADEYEDCLFGFGKYDYSNPSQ